MSLSTYVHAMGRGPSRARSLTRAEAADAMAQILSGAAAPEAVGALLMLMRYRGETADEVAGFTDAARAGLGGDWQGLDVTLDWPSYAAGRSRGLPWFLLSAKLLAGAGHRVLLHGWNSHQNPVADVAAGVEALSIPVVADASGARAALDGPGIAYVPLAALSPRLLEILRLRDVLGLRSAVNTVCRMLNPSRAGTMVQGVFHPPYRDLQRDAATILGQPRLLVIKGGGGEFERHPAKTCTLMGLSEGEVTDSLATPLMDEHRRLADDAAERPHLGAVWSGQRHDPWAEAVITGTAALALGALDPDLPPEKAEAEARALWAARHRSLAA